MKKVDPVSIGPLFLSPPPPLLPLLFSFLFVVFLLKNFKSSKKKKARLLAILCVPMSTHRHAQTRKRKGWAIYPFGTCARIKSPGDGSKVQLIDRRSLWDWRSFFFFFFVERKITKKKKKKKTRRRQKRHVEILSPSLSLSHS